MVNPVLITKQQNLLVLDVFNVKAFEDDEINMAKMIDFDTDLVKITVEKGENSVNQHFSLPFTFFEAFHFSGLYGKGQRAKPGKPLHLVA